MGEPKNQLRDLPKFSGEKAEDPQEFIYQFKHFLTYINHTVDTPEKAEKALNYLGGCLTLKARDWFQNHVGDPRIAPNLRTVAQYEEILKNFLRAFHPLGKTKEQLEMSWTNLKWAYPTENIEDFARKVRQLANVLGKSQEDKF